MEKDGQKKDANLCYVCKKNKICIRVLPCKHAYLCRRCAMRMASGKCKICHEFYLYVKGMIPGEPLDNEDNDSNDE